MEEKDLNQPATKGDITAVKGDLAALKSDIKLLDGKIGRLEEIAKTTILDVLHIKEDIGGIRATMSTKDDINRIMNFMDTFAADYSSYQNRDVIRGNEVIKHGEILNEHEARLQKLETK